MTKLFSLLRGPSQCNHTIMSFETEQDQACPQHIDSQHSTLSYIRNNSYYISLGDSLVTEAANILLFLHNNFPRKKIKHYYAQKCDIRTYVYTAMRSIA